MRIIFLSSTLSPFTVTTTHRALSCYCFVEAVLYVVVVVAAALVSKLVCLLLLLLLGCFLFALELLLNYRCFRPFALHFKGEPGQEIC